MMLTREQALNSNLTTFHFMPPDAKECTHVTAHRTGRTKTRVRNVTWWAIPVTIDRLPYLLYMDSADYWHIEKECPDGISDD